MMKLLVFKKRFLWIVVIFFVSCNNPLKRVYTFSGFENDIPEIRRANKLSEGDLQLLTNYILVARLSGNNFSGKTYEEIFEKIKNVQQKNEAAGAREEMEKESQRQRLAPYLVVSLIKKEFLKNKDRDVMAYSISLKNISSEKIKTIAGNITINDLLEKPIKELNIFIDEDILPGQTLTKTEIIPYNNSDINDQRMRSKDLVDTRVLWNPEKIILESGKLLQ